MGGETAPQWTLPWAPPGTLTLGIRLEVPHLITAGLEGSEKQGGDVLSKVTQPLAIKQGRILNDPLQPEPAQVSRGLAHTTCADPLETSGYMLTLGGAWGLGGQTVQEGLSTPTSYCTATESPSHCCHLNTSLPYLDTLPNLLRGLQEWQGVQKGAKRRDSLRTV